MIYVVHKLIRKKISLYVFLKDAKYNDISTGSRIENCFTKATLYENSIQRTNLPGDLFACVLMKNDNLDVTK